MTAEVAILNKTAVALAADSAVTISSGNNQQKIFDSADKLFELSCFDPIAVMVNGDMNLSQTPLPVLIKEFRENEAKKYESVYDASREFLTYLAKFGVNSPLQIKIDYFEGILRPWFERVHERARENVLQRIMDPNRPKGEALPAWDVAFDEALTEQLRVLKYGLERSLDAEFVEIGEDGDGAARQAVVDELRQEIFDDLNEEQVSLVNDIANLAVVKRIGSNTTGIIVAGFGSRELFPTLVHYTVFGIVGNKLKFMQNDLVDIERTGVRAKVLPFAQKEMVERFLYGLDEGIRRDIARFCEQSLPGIRENLIGQLEMEEADRQALEVEAKAAEKAFMEGLVADSFDSIRQESEAEIEGMVEFMPKPELARMAEALVDLTSIKRRVTRGFETVGGPIDVAVISKAEGLVWVKRKHYFPAELNQRFLQRRAQGSRARGDTGD
jgi:hypothetical protein